MIETAIHTSLSLRSVKSSSRSSLSSPSSGSRVKPGLKAQFVHSVASISSNRPCLPVGRSITLSSGGIKIQVSIFRRTAGFVLQERRSTRCRLTVNLSDFKKKTPGKLALTKYLLRCSYRDRDLIAVQLTCGTWSSNVVK